ncbi:MAG TPA: TonB family protein [Thermoanaerobaculia bacterium]|nr:TonB family protein [Thermoanaerobaculia bacterium]
MEDRVGDVLARRAALDSGAAPAIAISILLHAGITGFAAWHAWHHPAPLMTGGNLAISVMSMPAQAPRISAPPAVKAPPQPKMEVPAVPQPVAAPVVKPNDKVVPKALTGKSTKTGVDAVAPTVPAPAAPSTTTGGGKPGITAATTDVAVGDSGVTGIEGDFRDAAYIVRMKELIATHWLRPQITGGAGATIYFIVERDGKIRDAATEKPSGNGTFDRAALRAVLEASPLPPLPWSYNGAFVGVHLTFK